MTKSEIYEYGKKLVDNSKTEKVTEFEHEIKEQIKSFKELIKQQEEEIEYRKAIDDKLNIAFCRVLIKEYKNKIKMLKSCL